MFLPCTRKRRSATIDPIEGEGPLRKPKRISVLVAIAIAAIATLGASRSSASTPKTPPPGTFRIGTTGASWATDPGLAYLITAWELEYATCAKLVNYPDSPWDDHDASRLRPEIAAGMPTVSGDGLTYTFQIRNTTPSRHPRAAS